jgi:hypothetical protein
MKYRSLLFLVCLLFVASTAHAQPADSAKTAPKTAANTKPAKDPEAERLLKERRDNAQSLLLNMAADADRFNDQKLRARTQARIADALWDADPERARSLFRKAWDAAEIVDQEGQRKMQEDLRQQEARGGSVAVTGPPNIRGEVLRLVARRDRALGEELLAKLRMDKQEEANQVSDRAKSRPMDTNTPEGLTQRLSLARQLLRTDDVARAIQFADPALTTVTREGIDFLSYLRDKDAAAADQRYMALVAGAGANLQADANTVSLLSSYLFTPHLFVTFNGGGASSMQSGQSSGPIAPAPQITQAFFRTATAILMRPLAPPGQDQSPSGTVGKYMIIKRLLPLFEQYTNSETTEALRGQMQALASMVPEGQRDREDDNALREGLKPPDKVEDREKALLDRIDRAKTSDERDALFIQLARLYSDNADMRARETADKVEDLELRKKVRPFIDATLVLRLIDKKDADKVLEIVHTGELTRPHKAWALTQAAKLLVKTDRDRAFTILEEADAEARRIDASDPDRPRAMMAIANIYFLGDKSKAWDTTYDAVKAANGAETFTGEDGLIRLALQTKTMSTIRSSTVGDFDVAGIFTELAKEDYNRTVELARSFEREAPRANAVIAIARTVLDDKKK